MKEQLTVFSIISNHSWFLDKLSLSLHFDTIELINCIYIPFSTNKLDQSLWNQTSLGNFTTKSAYLLLLQITNQLPSHNPTNNSWIWHSKCLNKLKIFLWLLVPHKLPTKNFLYKKKNASIKPLSILSRPSGGHKPHLLYMQKSLPLMAFVPFMYTSSTQP